MRQMAANVNLDMPILRYEFTDMVAFGSDHSNLGPIAAEAAQRADGFLSPDPLPEQSLFVRSDHYNFVLAGVPSLFLMTGFNSPDAEDNEGQGFLRFLGSDYHGPDDEYGPLVRYDQGAKFARINYGIISAIANNPQTPAWYEDSIFNPN